MRHRLSTLLIPLLPTAALLLTLGSCKKKGDESDPESIPVDTATAEAAEPTDTAAASESAEPAASVDPTATASATAVASATATSTYKRGSSIDACCAALRSQATDDVRGTRMRQAAATCSSIAGLVRQGKTSRANAMAQIRSAAGGSVPAACR